MEGKKGVVLTLACFAFFVLVGPLVAVVGIIIAIIVYCFIDEEEVIMINFFFGAMWSLAADLIYIFISILIRVFGGG